MRICIDPGHGGRDSGAVADGLKEKTPALTISLILAELLELAGYEVIMTRRKDEFVELQNRANIANRKGADLFVSVHHNSFTDSEANGIETYYFEGSNEGHRIAEIIQDNLIGYSGWTNRGVKTAEFSVLRNTRMPAVLLEIGFISNSNEREGLKDCNILLGFAKAIFKAIKEGYDVQ